MQLAIDSLDRLVELVEERGGRVAAGDAARELFALGRTTDAVARSLLGPLVEGDDRLVWRGASVALAASPSPRLEEASFCVFDLERTSLAALAHFFGTAARPCHRALPDAEATAEILLRLVELAQERQALTLAELEELAAPRTRVVHGKRRLVHGAPSRPGVYLFHDRFGQVLYVGKARDLRSRLRSYFAGARQRPSVEAALAAAERIEWRVHGSELAAALDEVRLIRELRPPANARRPQPERYVYLGRRGSDVVVTRAPTPYGPLRRRAHAERAARALSGCSEAEFANLLDGEPLPRLQARMAELSECLRYEDAARLRDRIASLERVIARLRRLDELRCLRLRLVVPGAEPGSREEFFLSNGRIHRDLIAACAPGTSFAADHLDEIVVVGSFLERPPPELRVLPFP